MRQHDPDFLDNGNILIFDNLGRFSESGGKSRVMEFNPYTYEVTWRFEGTGDNVFFSDVRGSQQRLPNNNTLITESEAGRILEVTYGKNIVWEYVNPARNSADSALVAAVCWATRITPDTFDNEFLSMLSR
jgi:hypothetical protein